jgi:hypothetical protein
MKINGRRFSAIFVSLAFTFASLTLLPAGYAARVGPLNQPLGYEGNHDYDEYREFDEPTETEEARLERIAGQYKDLIAPQTVNTFRGDVRLRGFRPIVAGITAEDLIGDGLDDGFVEELNRHFEAQYNEFVRTAGENTRTLEFNFDVTVSGGFVNVLFYCGRAAVSTERLVLTTVIDADSGAIVTVTDIIGGNGVRLINRALSAQIAANPARYSSAFAGITPNNAFYMDNGDAVMLFNEFALVNAGTGITAVRVQLGGFANLSVGSEYQYTKGTVGIRMVQLKKVADGFGFELAWNEPTQTVDMRGNGFDIEMTIGRNAYSGARNLSPVRLESAPELRLDDGRTYLPLSFFEQILGLAYSVSLDDGIILFTSFDDGRIFIGQHGE